VGAVLAGKLDSDLVYPRRLEIQEKTSGKMRWLAQPVQIAGNRQESGIQDKTCAVRIEGFGGSIPLTARDRFPNFEYRDRIISWRGKCQSEKSIFLRDRFVPCTLLVEYQKQPAGKPKIVVLPWEVPRQSKKTPGRW
jgi:hypothetical protein